MRGILRNIHDAAYVSFLHLPLAMELQIQPGSAGFFGALFITLNGLRLAELYGKSAKVLWGSSSPYFEVSRGSSAWDYFFEISEFNFSKDRGNPKLIVPYRPSAHNFTAYNGLTVRESVIRALRAWCQPRYEITDAVSEFALLHFGQRPMLGVHVRLTDAAAGYEARETVGIEKFMFAVDSWLESQPNGGIFLASDDQRVVTSFEERYGGRLVWQECLRSKDGKSVHGHYDDGVAGSPYRKGREVLIDALLLARCNHMIRTHSLVTAFSLCWNPNMTYRDLEKECLGIDCTPWLHAGIVT